MWTFIHIYQLTSLLYHSPTNWPCFCWQRRVTFNTRFSNSCILNPLSLKNTYFSWYLELFLQRAWLYIKLHPKNIFFFECNLFKVILTKTPDHVLPSERIGFIITFDASSAYPSNHILIISNVLLVVETFPILLIWCCRHAFKTLINVCDLYKL